jgi:hypothetical protein
MTTTKGDNFLLALNAVCLILMFLFLTT